MNVGSSLLFSTGNAMNTPESNKSSSEATAKVKCQECGFLAWRNIHTRELVEAEAEYRKNPDMSITELARNFQSEPLCYLAAYDIRREIKEHVAIPGSNGQEPSNKVLHVISKERDCLSYTEWTHGLSPKEHLNMNLLEAQRKREDARDDALRAREDRRDAFQRKWQTRMARKSMRYDEKRQNARDERQRQWQEDKDKQDEIKRIARDQELAIRESNRDARQSALQASLVDRQIKHQALSGVIQAVVSIVAALIAAFGLAVAAYFMDRLGHSGNSAGGQGNAAVSTASPSGRVETIPAPPPAKPTE